MSTGASPAADAPLPAPRSAPLLIPDHELLHRIGSGSYGDVWLARNAVGTMRAVKIVRRASFKNERPYEREFSGMLKFEPVSRSHEGLMDILQVGRNDEAGYFYYVMELADDARVSVDEPLPESENRDRLGRDPAVARAREGPPGVGRYHPLTLSAERAIRGRLPLADCLRHFSSLAGALATLHRAGLIHRDIKPSNIIIVGGVAKLADIGLVADMDETRSFVGTEGFIPPEGPGTAQADVYSLGKVLYEVATGRDRKEYPSLPLGGDANNVSADLLELNAIISRACSADLTQRYASAMEMHADLAVLQSGRSVRSLHTFESRLRAAKRGGLVAAVVAVVALGALALASWTARVERDARAKTETAWRRAEAAEQNARDKLYESLVANARAEHRSDLIGRRFAMLESVQRASELRPGTLELRDAAITALTVPDIRPQFRLELPPGATAQAVTVDLRQRILGDSNGLLQVLPLEGGAPLFTFGRPGPAPTVISPRAGGDIVAVRRGSDRSEWWRLENGALIAPGEIVVDLIESDDRRWRAQVDADDRVTLLDTGTGVRRNLTPGSRIGYYVRFLDDATLVIASRRGSEIRLVDVATGVDRRVFRTAFRDTPGCLAVGPDESVIAIGSSGGELSIHAAAVPDQPRYRIAPHDAAIAGVTFHPDGDWALTCSWDDTTRLVGINEGKPLSLLRAGHKHHVFSPDGRRLAGYDLVGTGLTIYECAGREACRVLGEAAPVGPNLAGPWNGDFSPDGRLLAAATYDGIRIYETRFGQEVGHLDNRNWYSVVFAGNSNLVAAGRSGLVRWPLSGSGTGELRIGSPVTLDPSEQWHALAARDGSVVASASFLGRFLLLEPDQTRREIRHGTDARGVILSADGRWAATPGVVWDTRTGRERLRLPLNGCFAGCLAPSGDRLARCDADAISVVELDTRKELWRTGLPRGGTPIAWSPDGRLIAAVRDGMVPYLLDAVSGEVLARLEHPDTRPYNAVVFSPDGSLLACFSPGHRIHLWNLHVLRRELAARKLDWNLPPAVPAPPVLPAPRVLIGGRN